MWLLDVHTRKLVYFADDREVIGKYAILSHTWDEEEVLFHEIELRGVQMRRGYQKIHYACLEAARQHLQYAWIDTCCINKDSSAELSEAINSMWKYYWNAKLCFVYLSDFYADRTLRRLARNAGEDIFLVQRTSLEKCRWHKRGWTLQELMAPKNVDFFDKSWNWIGSKRSSTAGLSLLTGINRSCLENRRNIFDQSAAARLSWASFRKTTREEDSAYCLFGLFNINLPLLYGEGAKAFTRLQEEIIKTSNDQSILAWTPWRPQHQSLLLAPHVYGFRNAGRITLITNRLEDDDWTRTFHGLRLTLPTVVINAKYRKNYALVALNCKERSEEPISLLVRRTGWTRGTDDTNTGRPVYVAVRTRKSYFQRPFTNGHGNWRAEVRWNSMLILRRTQDITVVFNLQDGLQKTRTSSFVTFLPPCTKLAGHMSIGTFTLQDRITGSNFLLCFGTSNGSLSQEFKFCWAPDSHGEDKEMSFERWVAKHGVSLSKSARGYSPFHVSPHEADVSLCVRAWLLDDVKQNRDPMEPSNTVLISIFKAQPHRPAPETKELLEAFDTMRLLSSAIR